MNIFQHGIIPTKSVPFTVTTLTAHASYGNVRQFDFMKQPPSKIVLMGRIEQTDDTRIAGQLKVWTTGPDGNNYSDYPTLLVNCPVRLDHSVPRKGFFFFTITTTIRGPEVRSKTSGGVREVVVEHSFIDDTTGLKGVLGVIPAGLQTTTYRATQETYSSLTAGYVTGAGAATGVMNHLGWEVLTPHGYSPVPNMGKLRSIKYEINSSDNLGQFTDNGVDVYLSSSNNWILPLSSSRCTVRVIDDIDRFNPTANTVAKMALGYRGVVVFDTDPLTNTGGFTEVGYRFVILSPSARFVRGVYEISARTDQRTQIILDMSLETPILTARTY